MPLLLTEPETTSINSFVIKRIDINLAANKHSITLDERNDLDAVIGERILSINIFDDFGNILTPKDWPETNPTGLQMYALIQQFIFMGLQDSGLGAGTIV